MNQSICQNQGGFAPVKIMNAAVPMYVALQVGMIVRKTLPPESGDGALWHPCS